MGVSAHAYMMLGIEVEESDFWTATSSVRSCKNGHIPIPAADFCTKCGSRIEIVYGLTPSSYLIKEALRKGVSPDQFFQSLKDNGDIHSSSEETSSEDRLKDEPWILCITLAPSTSMEELERSKDTLLAKAEAYGITGREIKLYSNSTGRCKMSAYDDLLKLLRKDDPPYSLTIATSIVEIVGHLEGISAKKDIEE